MNNINSKLKLIEKCESWNHSGDSFWEIFNEFTSSYGKINLSNKFGIQLFLIDKWLKKAEIPDYSMQMKIIKWIKSFLA